VCCTYAPVPVYFNDPIKAQMVFDRESSRFRVVCVQINCPIRVKSLNNSSEVTDSVTRITRIRKTEVGHCSVNCKSITEESLWSLYSSSELYAPKPETQAGQGQEARAAQTPVSADLKLILREFDQSLMQATFFRCGRRMSSSPVTAHSNTHSERVGTDARSSIPRTCAEGLIR
jgi:hypothetical protein